jgi:RimJ/RimL family protein N-acetyltransferase
VHHDLTLTDGPYTLRPLQGADTSPLMALARANAAEYAHMGTLPSTPGFYTAGLEAPDQLVFTALVGGELAGSTRYLDVRLSQRGLEIGSTWLAPSYMRTGANRVFKRLLLAHAFEVMNLSRVQIKTDVLNTRSQTAIERLGAVREGVLRQHMVRPDGSMRDTVMYSILDHEWPKVRARLEARRP